MNEDTIQKIINLNKDFYDAVSEEFSSTRQSPWHGWNRVVDILNSTYSSKPIIKVVDLGCGNCRLLDFLLQRYAGQFDYIGIDSTEAFLESAKNKYKAIENAQFKVMDMFSNVESSEIATCDVLFAFGVTHHIPSSENRKVWFKSLAQVIDSGGMLVLSYWDFLKIHNADDLQKSVKNDRYQIAEAELQENDYFLGWNNNPNIYRYCHFFTIKEKDEITKYLDKLGLSLIINYRDDGRTGDLNKYYIYMKY